MVRGKGIVHGVGSLPGSKRESLRFHLAWGERGANWGQAGALVASGGNRKLSALKRSKALLGRAVARATEAWSEKAWGVADHPEDRAQTKTNYGLSYDSAHHSYLTIITALIATIIVI